MGKEGLANYLCFLNALCRYCFSGSVRSRTIRRRISQPQGDLFSGL
jgi:hypothetical protein